jgi:hypothetical protein
VLLAAGDLVALLAFAAVGRINHGGVADLETIYTAMPFIAGRYMMDLEGCEIPETTVFLLLAMPKSKIAIEISY